MKNRLRIFVLSFGLFCSFSITAMGQSQKMKQLYPTHKGKSYTAFLKSFDYGSYLQTVNFTDFTNLQKDRYFLYKRFGDGDLFLYYLAEYFTNNYPVYPSSIDDKISIGESFLKAKARGITNNNREVYTMIGYFVLSKVAYYLEHQKQIDLNSALGQNYVTRLRANKVSIKVEGNTMQKLQKNIQQGNWDYLLQRAMQKTYPYSKKLDQFLADEFEEYYQLLLSFVPVLTLNSPNTVQTKNQNSHVQTSLSLEPMNAYQKHARGYAVTHWKIADAGIPIGYAIWMERPSIKAHYFIEGRRKAYQHLLAQNNVVLATTGGFTNNYSLPEGLTVESGKVVNAVLMHDRDGLVVITKSGGIRIINLKNNQIILPTGNGSIQIENPRNSLIAYARLMDWCRKQKATLFQTQLLAYSNQQLLKVGSSSNSAAERRFLALVSDRRGNVQHIIFHIPKPHSLAQLTNSIFGLLRSKGMKVEAILNLDTGGQNVLFTHAPNATQVSEIQGRLPISGTTNLLIYSYR